MPRAASLKSLPVAFTVAAETTATEQVIDKRKQRKLFVIYNMGMGGELLVGERR